MELIQQNIHIWKHLFTYMDYETRISMNRIFSKSRESKKLTKEQIELHDIHVSSSFLSSLIAKVNSSEKKEELMIWTFEKFLEPRNQLILSINRIKWITIQKFTELARDAGPDLLTVMYRIIQHIRDNKREIEHTKAITVF